MPRPSDRGCTITHPSRVADRIRSVTPETTDDVLNADTRPIAAVPGRHVAPATTKLSIHSFVGGRFPRHRAEERESSDRV
jgi:hypothetical protein